MARPKEVRAWPYLLAYAIIIIIASSWRFFTQLLGMSFESLFHSLFLLTMVLMFYFAISNLNPSTNSKNPLHSLYSLFLILGIGFTLSGITTTLLVLFATTLGIPQGTRELLNMYLQVSLNFLLGGLTLVGASLPVLQSLFGQSKGETTSTPQSSGESGGGQQSK